MSASLQLMYEMFRFLNRDELDYVSRTCRFTHAIINRHFSVKPYRYLRHTMLVAHRDSSGLTLHLEKWLEDDSGFSGYIYFNYAFLQREWLPFDLRRYHLEILRPFFSEHLRIEFVKISIEGHPFAPDEVAALASVSHIWAGQIMKITGYSDVDEGAQNFMFKPVDLFFTTPNLLGCRQMTLTDVAFFTPLKSYPIVFTLNVVVVEMFEAYVSHQIILDFIECKKSHPQSDTTLVLDIYRLMDVSILVNEFKKNFLSDSCTGSFRILFANNTKYDIYDNEFSLRNPNTDEVLQLRKISRNEASRYCYIDVMEYQSFSVMDRSFVF
ncbi:hypothetical protein DdX_03700 [Ditylenchus destructor]|uniref:F-box domain-containing protein n=1 Tax=Ditylenchus destructor TaxID=166010 RepID=A0AAD4NFR7_9BILA|nr:hypothetical protein DdX_03700 [Ditylenchus destructor]